MEPAENILFQIHNEKGEVQTIQFDRKILNFNIQYLSNNHHEPYPIPQNIAQKGRPFDIMRQFVLAHDYNPAKVKVNKPIRSSKYEEVVDPITFKIFHSMFWFKAEYCDENLSEEVAEVVALSRFLRFHQLTDAISAAVAVNYFIGDDEKSLEEFIKSNGLEDMSTDEICQIIKLYEDQFRLIEIKAKEEMMKINEGVGS